MDGRPVDLARARREAKALLSAARAGDPAARERVLAACRAADAEALRLADAQLAIARELGAPSWPALVRDAQARAMARDERARALVEWATSGRRDDAEAVLALDPGLARAALDAALVLGDAERVDAALADDAGWRAARSACAAGSRCSTSPTRPSSAAGAPTASSPARTRCCAPVPTPMPPGRTTGMSA